jgi:hypothetical protein
MADKEAILGTAYGYFNDWGKTSRDEFEKLLLDDGDDQVVWIEDDDDLNPGTYQGKSAVMDHLDFVKQQPTTTRDIKIAPHGQDWRTTDYMKAGAHPEHRCVTNVTFKGDFIAVVHHCIDHGGGRP